MRRSLTSLFRHDGGRSREPGLHRVKAAQDIAAFLSALHDCPDDSRLLAGLGEVLYQNGSLPLASCYFRQALATDPDNALLHVRVGASLCEARQLHEGLYHLRRAVALSPDSPDARLELGKALGMLNEQRLAVDQYTRVLKSRCYTGRAACGLAEAYFKMNDFTRTIHFARLALRHSDCISGVRSILARAYAAIGEFDRAIRVVKFDSNGDPLAAKFTEAAVQCRANRVRESIRLCREILSIRSDLAHVHFLLAWCLLALGDFDAGWREYEWRLRLSATATEVPRLPASMIGALRRRRRVTGKVFLLCCEQGYGDSLFFIRYAQDLVSLGARVVVLCQPQLVRLFHAVAYLEDVVPYGGLVPSYDYHTMIGSLPGIFCQRVEDIVGDAPYLPLSNGETTRPFVKSTIMLNVGIVWKGKRLSAEDNRGVDIAQFTPLFCVQGADYYSLEVGLHTPELGLVHEYSNLHDAANGISDFQATAERLNQLDLLITVDTGIAHLAGSLGKPVFLLLPFSADWRWFTNDPRSPFYSKSPWYPSVRCFRQPSLGCWAPVFKQVETAVRDEASRKGASLNRGPYHRMTQPPARGQAP